MPEGQDLETQAPESSADTRSSEVRASNGHGVDELDIPVDEAREPVKPVTGDVTVPIDPAELPPLLPVGEARDEPPFEPKVAEEAAKWEQLIVEYEREAAALGN